MLAALNVLALLGVIVLANAFIYKVLPDVKLSWRDVWPGSISCYLSNGCRRAGDRACILSWVESAQPSRRPVRLLS